MSRDDMKMTPRVGLGAGSTRERANEERRSKQAARKRRGLLSRLRRVRALRQARRVRKGRAGRAGRGGVGIGAKSALKAGSRGLMMRAGSRAIPVVGWALLAVDVLVQGVKLDKRFRGRSGRLVEAEDAHTVMGVLDEEAIANAEALNFVESDADLLRSIGRAGKMSSSMATVVEKIKALALARAHGADLIRRDPHFDSADSLLDKIILRANESGLRDKVDTTIRALRAEGHGRMKTGR